MDRSNIEKIAHSSEDKLLLAKLGEKRYRLGVRLPMCKRVKRIRNKAYTTYENDIRAYRNLKNTFLKYFDKSSAA